MKKNNWYAITGGPSSGKSTTIELIKRRGYKTTTETARDYIASQIRKGFSAREVISNAQKLQDEIARLQLELEASLSHDEHIFLDRAFPDAIGYYNHHRTIIPPFAQNKYKQSFYNKVFYLERMPVKTDEIRLESDYEAELIAKHVYESYKKLGLEIIKIPVMARKERVELLLSHIFK